MLIENNKSNKLISIKISRSRKIMKTWGPHLFALVSNWKKLTINLTTIWIRISIRGRYIFVYPRHVHLTILVNLILRRCTILVITTVRAKMIESNILLRRHLVESLYLLLLLLHHRHHLHLHHPIDSAIWLSIWGRVDESGFQIFDLQIFHFARHFQIAHLRFHFTNYYFFFS